MMALNMLRRWLNGQPLASERPAGLTWWIPSRCKVVSPRRAGFSRARRLSSLLYSPEKFCALSRNNLQRMVQHTGKRLPRDIAHTLPPAQSQH